MPGHQLTNPGAERRFELVAMAVACSGVPDRSDEKLIDHLGCGRKPAIVHRDSKFSTPNSS